MSNVGDPLDFNDISSFLECASVTDDLSSLDALYHHALARSDDLDWLIAQAYLLWRLSRFKEQLTLLNSLPNSVHSNPQFWLLCGLGLKSIKSDPFEVLDCYKTAFSLDDSRFDIAFNLANTYYELNDPSCESLYMHSLHINPFNSSCWYNYSKYLLDNKRYDELRRALKFAILLSPSETDYYCNLGLAFYANKYWPSAERSFLISISLESSLYQAYMNLGSLYVSSRRLPEALSVLHESVELASQTTHSSQSLFHLGLCHLLLGKYSTGWALYQHRLYSGLVPLSSAPTSGILIESFQQLLDCKGSSVVVWAEQGFGDCIQFSRYLPLLTQLDISFQFYCHPSLVPLISHWLDCSFPVTPIPPHCLIDDFRPHFPLLSFPFLLSTTLDSIPSSIPYLTPPRLIPRPDHLKIPDAPGGLSVGLVWASNSLNTLMYSNKSIPLNLLFDIFNPLISNDLINIHSLQVGADSNLLNPYLQDNRVFDWSSKINNFSDTAFLVDQLDLVISIDTSVSHLSAAVNCPTWLLLPFDSDFRWLSDRHDSPWYPNVMRLFRQSDRDDWSSVIQELQLAFNRLFLVDIAALDSSDSPI
ncbi:hypothetical protein FZZ91_01170 [Synechococcus sp. HB1133]|uniref:tetratricopeptide repeat protein n=1 Tax=unclassified Synechococcus TaxID=2626047 RepID=UPI00140810DA|nr:MULTISPECIES: tetratricopeptide repeat protein [unclassified Synechococcus]MCB4421448.1 hypothetical protein [Synechococcus sp. HB1133]MCB4431201.1 hypothetical protein [Synechococcus sp. HBA1120]NHI80390.1 hypothetical protein [Synechococcus sp. HB1133]